MQCTRQLLSSYTKSQIKNRNFNFQFKNSALNHGVESRVLSRGMKSARCLYSSTSHKNSLSSSTSQLNKSLQDGTSQSQRQQESKMMIGFKCKVCSTTNTKTMSKLSYEKGVVIIKCDGCKSLHLIAGKGPIRDGFTS